MSSPAARAALVVLALAASATLRAATITVNSTDDLPAADDGKCTLREAVAAANGDTASGVMAGECAAGAGTDRIEFSLALPATIALNLGPLALTDNATIAGPGAAGLRIEGQGLSRVLVLWEETPLTPRSYTLQGLTLSGGWGVNPYDGWGANDGGAIAVHFAAATLSDLVIENNLAQDSGGGVYYEGVETLTVERCSFVGNETTNFVLSGSGGGLAANGGHVVIRESTFDSNQANGDNAGAGGALLDGHGGAITIWATGSLTIDRSTFHANTALGAGGAIAISLPGAATSYDIPTTITSSTFTANEADTDADGDDSGGALKVWPSKSGTTLANSLLAANLDHAPNASDAAPDLAGDASAAAVTVTSGGHDLIGIRKGSAAASFTAGQPNPNGDWVGTSPSPLDPGLEPLAENGGPTATVALNAGSAAIDHGSCPGEAHDQRGYVGAATGTRSVDDPAVADTADGCDIGAYEADAVPVLTLTVDGFESGGFDGWSRHT